MKFRWLKYILWALIILLIILPALVFLLFQIPQIQEFFNSKLSNFLQNQLNAKIYIEKVYYEPPFKLVVKNLYLEDINNDTLFHIQKAKIAPFKLNFKKNTFEISRIEINNLTFKYIADSTGYSNLDYFVDHIPESPSSTETSHFKLVIKKIIIRNSNFVYKTDEKLQGPFETDFRNLHFTRFNLKLANLYILDDSVAFSIQNLWAYEKSGFRIKHFSSFFSYKDTLKFEKNIIATNYSQIVADHIKIKPKESWTDYANMFIDIDISPLTTFDANDLKFFTNKINQFFLKIKLGIDVEGLLSDLTIKKFIFNYGNETEVSLSGNIKNLMNINNLNLNLAIDKLNISIDELRKLKNPINNTQIVKIPEESFVPSWLNLKGKISGTTKDLRINLNIASDLINIYPNLKIEIKDSANYSAQGRVKITNAKLAKLTKIKDLKELKLEDTFYISISNKKIKNLYNLAFVDTFFYNNYTYKNISSKTYIENDTIKGYLKIDDANLKTNITYSILQLKKGVKGNISFAVDTAKFYHLNIFPNDRYSSLAMNLSSNFVFYDKDNFYIDVKFQKPATFIKNLLVLKVKKFELNAKTTINQQDTNYTFNFNNDYFRIQAQSNLKVNKIAYLVKHLVNIYLPALNQTNNQTKQTEIKLEKDKYLTLQAQIGDLSTFYEMFQIKTQIASNSSLQLEYSNEQLKSTFTTDSLKISKNKIFKTSITLNGDTNKLKINANLDSIYIGNFKFKNIEISSNTENNKINLLGTWDNKILPRNKGRLNTIIEFIHTPKKPQISIKIEKDTIVVENYGWLVSTNEIFIDENKIFVDRILLYNKLLNEYIKINGTISKNPEDTLVIEISNFDLSQFNSLVKKAEIGGKLHLVTKVTSVLDTPQVYLIDSIKSAQINNIIVGDIFQEVRYSPRNNILELYTKLYKSNAPRENKNLILFANLNYSLNEKNLNLKLDLEKLQLRAFEPFYSEILNFSSLSYISGNIVVSGNLKEPRISGKTSIYGSFRVVPTDVTYTINGGLNIDFNEHKITINPAVLVGPNLIGDALLQGEIIHENFKNPYLNISLRADTMPVYRALKKPDSKIYGNIFLSGYLNIRGYLDALNVKADIYTNDNTNITLVLNQTSKIVSQVNMVQFVNIEEERKEGTQIIDITQKQKTKKFTLDLDANISLNKNAKFKIFINQANNEYIELQASGNLKVLQTPFGDLILFGKAEIEKGIYNFVFQNIITKKFQIQQGSTITLNGSPLDAVLDIKTFYTIRNASLYNLFLDEKYLNTKTNANCIIEIKGPLKNPIIKFDVQIPTSDKKIQNQLSSLDANEINKQFVSLLVLGRFQPLPGLAYDPNSEQFLSTAFDPGQIIANQLNSILSSFNTNIDLNINYITGSNVKSDEVNVGMTIPLFNDRVNISTDFGYKSNALNQQNQVIGNFEVTYKMNKKGNLQLKAYNKSDEIKYTEQGYTQGLGILFTTSLDKIFQKKDSIKK